MGIPRLKSATVSSADGQVCIWHQALRRVYLDDPTGSVLALLRLLAEGDRPVPALLKAMAERGHAISERELLDALHVLDGLGVLEQADGDEVLDEATKDRHYSNLRFYDFFSRLDRTSASLHQTVERSRVLLLGAGGLGSGILQSLVGLGVGEVTIVDIDTVATKNLARQFVYGLDAVGRPKVTAARDWAASYSPGTRVNPVHRRIGDVPSIVELGSGADIIVCAIDSPDNVRLMVNEAAFELGIPFVTGGLSQSTLAYFSVHPGRTACLLCLERQRDDEETTLADILRNDPVISPAAVNRATGPVVQLISGLMSMEILRYLTGIEPPVAGATYHLIELADQLASARSPWFRHPSCPLCPAADARIDDDRTALAGSSRE